MQTTFAALVLLSCSACLFQPPELEVGGSGLDGAVVGDGGTQVGGDAAVTAGDTGIAAEDDSGVAPDSGVHPDAGPNRPPQAVADLARTDEDTQVIIGVTANDLDDPGDPLTVVSVTTPQHGTATAAGSGVSYRPALDYSGPDIFFYTMSDGAGAVSTASVAVTVDPIDDAPLAESFDLRTGYQTPIDFMLRALDPEGDTVTFMVITPPAHGSLTASMAEYTYTPAPGFSGFDTFTYVARGASLLPSNTATVTVGVLASDWRPEVDDWPYRRRVSVDNSAQSGAFGDFPVPIYLDSTNFDYSAGRADGRDLRFYGSTGGAMDYEIERWDSGGESILWLRIPLLAASAVTSFYMYYGNPGANDGEDRSGTWSLDFNAVFHFAGDVFESVIGLPAVSSGTQDVEGIVGRGRGLDGTAFVSLLPAFNTTQGTASMWINMPATFDINDQAILLYGNDSQNGARDGFGPESELHLGLDATEHLRFFTRGTGAAATDIDLAVSSGPALNDDDWHHVAVTWLELQEVVVYIDGSRVASAPFTPRRFASLQNTRIGSPAAVARRFIGLIDEVELSSVRHSDGWIAAHYASMTDPQFVVFGAVDDGLP